MSKLTEFGKAVRKARIDADMTMRDMADEFGVTPSFLYGVETGVKKINENILWEYIAIFRRLKIETPDLVDLAALSNGCINLKEDFPVEHKMMLIRLSATLLYPDEIRSLEAHVKHLRSMRPDHG